MNEVYTTRAFRLKPSQYVKAIASMWITRWWWIFAVPLAVILLMAVAMDVRFYVVALMMIFIIIPMILGLVYFNYALTPEACFSTINHTITVSRVGLRVDYVRETDDERQLPAREIPSNDILSYEDTGNSIFVHLRGGRYKIEIIPIEAIDTHDVKPLISLLSAIAGPLPE
jgi:hypothetical protein